MAQFSRYTLIGLFNTAVHWLSFAFLFNVGFSQAASNGTAFLIAASISFLLNSKFTFRQRPGKKNYAFFVLGMGSISLAIGRLGDIYQWNGMLTLIIFSFTSLALGFMWSKWVVFKKTPHSNLTIK